MFGIIKKLFGRIKKINTESVVDEYDYVYSYESLNRKDDILRQFKKLIYSKLNERMIKLKRFQVSIEDIGVTYVDVIASEFYRITKEYTEKELKKVNGDD